MKHYNLKRMIMKKSIILLAMVLGAFTAKAQSVVEGLNSAAILFFKSLIR